MILEKNIIEECETYCNFNWIEYKNNYDKLNQARIDKILRERNE